MKLTASQEAALRYALRIAGSGDYEVRVSYPHTIASLERLGLVTEPRVTRRFHGGRLTGRGLEERDRILRERSLR